MSTLHRGHIFHLTGTPTVQEAAEALVEIPDGALLVNDDGVIEWCGQYVDRPQLDGASVEVIDHGDAPLWIKVEKTPDGGRRITRGDE